MKLCRGSGLVMVESLVIALELLIQEEQLVLTIRDANVPPNYFFYNFVLFYVLLVYFLIMCVCVFYL